MNPMVAAGAGLTGDERARWHALAFAIERSKCYYQLRKQWYQRWALIVPGFSLLAGSIGVSEGLSQFGSTGRVVALALAALLAILAVLLRFNHRSFEYEGLIEKTKSIEARMIKGPQSKELLAELEEKRAEIAYGPERGVLNAVCHNRVVQSWGYEEKYLRPIAWWQQLLKQFLTEYRDPGVHSKAVKSTGGMA